MKIPDAFTAGEARLLGDSARSGKRPDCPRCGTTLDGWPVPPRADVSYVRDRLWLVCPTCHRTLVIDRREPP